MDLNRATILGRLTRDPEVRTTTSGQTVASFSVATGFTWKDANGVQQERTEFHNVIAWRKLGEICGQYLNKGKRVYIEGRLETKDWTGQDGVKRYRTEIVADNMIMLDGGTRPQPSSPTEEPAPAKTASPKAEAPHDSQITEEEIRVEDIPF